MILNKNEIISRLIFENGSVTQNIFAAALPMLVAQILNLLYNIVDRIYIARIPHIGTAALGAVGLCFPLVCRSLFENCSLFLLTYLEVVELLYFDQPRAKEK